MMSMPKTTLASNLRKALDEQGRSVRGLALDAGLLPDAVRNILRGLSKSPHPDSVDAMARVLAISAAALYGDAPWPAGQVAKEKPAKPTRRRKAARTVSPTIPEYVLEPGGPSGIAGTGRSPVAAWSIPDDVIGARGLGGDIAIVRAPSRLEDMVVGDRLLCDLATFARLPTPPGIFVIHDGVGHLLARVNMAGQGKARIDIGHGKPRLAQVDTVDIAARVLGRWAWL